MILKYYLQYIDEVLRRIWPFMRKKQNTKSPNASSWILTYWSIFTRCFYFSDFFLVPYKWQYFPPTVERMNIHGKNRLWNITFGISAQCQGVMMSQECCKLLICSFHWMTDRKFFLLWMKFPHPNFIFMFFFFHALCLYKPHSPPKTSNDLHTSPPMFKTM